MHPTTTKANARFILASGETIASVARQDVPQTIRALLAVGNMQPTAALRRQVLRCSRLLARLARLA